MQDKIMKTKADAMGQYLLKEDLDSKHSHEIVERDDGLIEATDYSDRYFADFSAWGRDEQKAMKFVRGAVLDIGCGAGRHALYLQSMGFDVTGIDNSPGAIKVCKARGVKKAKVLSIDQVDWFKPNSFNTIIMMGNNFGLFGTHKKAKKLLKKFLRITSADAQIIAETNNPYKHNKQVHRDYHKFNKKRGRWPGELRLRVRNGNVIGKWFDYILVSPEEIRKILAGSGWKLSKIIRSKGSTYIAIIKKNVNAR